MLARAVSRASLLRGIISKPSSRRKTTTFIKMWAEFNEQRDKTTNDPMEATFIGFRMWTQAVTQAGTADVNAVRQAMYGQRI